MYATGGPLGRPFSFARSNGLKRVRRLCADSCWIGMMQRLPRRGAMLTREDNELLTRVGPGTPMGKFMREYWIPACLSEELPVPDGPPLRVRLLGEDLIAFRDTDGKVGLVAPNCPH